MSLVPTSFEHLPEIVHALLPELRGQEWPPEAHADCSNCKMASGEYGPWSFDREMRCCTAQPSLANWLVGRALRRGGTGRDVLMKRLLDPQGVSAWGIDPQPHLDRKFADDAAIGFGRDTGLRCPYWVPGPLSCGIWHDRASTCRTWYCKHEDGISGAVAWARMHDALFEVESRLALWAINRGDPPDDGAPRHLWVMWFEKTAELVDRARPEDVKNIAGGLVRWRQEVVHMVDVRKLVRHRGVPPVLVPSVSELVRLADGQVLITGYSSFDAVKTSALVFELLAKLDGRPWREVVAEVRADLEARGVDVSWLTDALIQDLHRVAAVRDPGGADDLPYHVDTADAERWARARSRE
jgi:hypothetical protein